MESNKSKFNLINPQKSRGDTQCIHVFFVLYFFSFCLSFRTIDSKTRGKCSLRVFCECFLKDTTRSSLLKLCVSTACRKSTNNPPTPKINWTIENYWSAKYLWIIFKKKTGHKSNTRIILFILHLKNPTTDEPCKNS